MALDTLEKLHAAVRNVPDFPKKGIVFKDITPVLSDPALMSQIRDSRKFYSKKKTGLSFEAVFGEPLRLRKRRK